MSIPATTWQTVGPFFQIGLERLYNQDIAGEGVAGSRIRICGRVLDSEFKPVPDAVLEIWQANSHGKYDHPDDHQDKPLEPGFRGFGRVPTDDNGVFAFSTILPGSVPGPGNTNQAPHLVITLLMRGILRNLVTRAYFSGHPLNGDDPILKCVPPERRTTLMLKPSPNDASLYTWDLQVQGEGETVFFDF
jgi:protocatechuate 3,4-dioxygenase alpha subunit